MLCETRPQNPPSVASPQLGRGVHALVRVVVVLLSIFTHLAVVKMIIVRWLILPLGLVAW